MGSLVRIRVPAIRLDENMLHVASITIMHPSHNQNDRVSASTLQQRA